MLNAENNWRKWINTLDEADYEYGGEDITLTPADIELLKQGKILNFDVNMEYGCTLRLVEE